MTAKGVGLRASAPVWLAASTAAASATMNSASDKPTCCRKNSQSASAVSNATMTILSNQLPLLTSAGVAAAALASIMKFLRRNRRDARAPDGALRRFELHQAGHL